MQGQNTWSYHPYRPFLTDVGDIYICRVAPGKNNIRFAWLGEGVTDLIDYRDRDSALFGFQYADFEIEGEDIIFLCRTATGGARSYHDTNYSTFHRIKSFRELSK